MIIYINSKKGNVRQAQKGKRFLEVIELIITVTAAK